MRHLYFTIFCLILAGGCTSTYRPSPIPVPKQWPHKPVLTKKIDVPLKDLRWWQQYNRPTLNHLIEKAIQQNNDIQKAIANIEYAQSELQEVKLNWLPQATLMGGVSQFPILGNPGGFVLAAPLYIINIFQQYQQQQSSQQLVQASLYAKDGTTLMIISEVAASYFTLIAEQEAVLIYEALLKEERRYLQLAKAQYRAGLISDDDMLKIEGELDQINAQLDLVKHNIVISKNTLHYLLNENPGQFTIDDSFKTLNSNAIIPDNIPVKVLCERPDIRKNEAQLKAAHANVGSAIANLLPTITLGAYLGTGTTSHGPINIIEAYPSIPIDLSLFAQIRTSKAQFKKMYIEYVNGIRMALRDVDTDLSSFNAHTLQFKHLERALRHTNEYCGSAQKRYSHGLEDEIEITRCQIKLDGIKLMLNQSKLEKMLSIVKLYQDLAGGYHAL